jgi:hypothetical protein
LKASRLCMVNSFDYATALSNGFSKVESLKVGHIQTCIPVNYILGGAYMTIELLDLNDCFFDVRIFFETAPGIREADSLRHAPLLGLSLKQRDDDLLFPLPQFLLFSLRFPLTSWPQRLVRITGAKKIFKYTLKWSGLFSGMQKILSSGFIQGEKYGGGWI